VTREGLGIKPQRNSPWQQDVLKGILWAVLILVSILFFTDGSSHFVYVDF